MEFVSIKKSTRMQVSFNEFTKCLKKLINKRIVDFSRDVSKRKSVFTFDNDSQIIIEANWEFADLTYFLDIVIMDDPSVIFTKKNWQDVKQKYFIYSKIIEVSSRENTNFKVIEIKIRFFKSDSKNTEDDEFGDIQIHFNQNLNTNEKITFFDKEENNIYVFKKD